MVLEAIELRPRAVPDRAPRWHPCRFPTHHLRWLVGWLVDIFCSLPIDDTKPSCGEEEKKTGLPGLHHPVSVLTEMASATFPFP